MSMGTGAWRQTIARAAHLGARSLGVATPQSATVEAPNSAITALVRQIFFAAVPRPRILFMAADDGTNILDYCDRIARAIAETSQATVGLVARNPWAASPVQTLWQKESVSAPHLGGTLWRIPFESYETHVMEGNLDEEMLRFDYMIFGASIRDGAAHLLCKASNGVVLVVTANQTRREAALRAKQILLSWNVELLGAVLDNRDFPVPESIYRRL